jgi:hypothetical protein
MPNYEHKKIIETITQLDAPPSDVRIMLDVFQVNAGITLRHRLVICSARCNSATGGCGSLATPSVEVVPEY